MKIILSQDVQNLGEEGDIREVARGYARNYLIPKGFGVLYTKQNLALLEGRRKVIEKRKEVKRDHAAGLRERIEALQLQIPMTVGDSGRLFGSVTNTMLAEELAKLGIEVERKKIEIPEHTIKTTGNFVIRVKLYGTEVASLKVTVTGPKGAEATPAAETESKPETPAEESTVEAGEAQSQESAAAEATAEVEESGDRREVVAEEEAATEKEPDAEESEETTDSIDDTDAAEDDEESAERD